MRISARNVYYLKIEKICKTPNVQNKFNDNIMWSLVTSECANRYILGAKIFQKAASNSNVEDLINQKDLKYNQNLIFS